MEMYEYPKSGYFPLPYKVIGKRNKYIDVFGAFDIETSNVKCPTLDNPDNVIAIMYIWQYTDAIDRVYYGRTWESLLRFVQELTLSYHLSSTQKMVWYIHNLAFEFQFIRSIFSITSVFATDIRKPVKCTLNGIIEARCSYRLTNMSLEKFCESQQTYYQKIKNFDYKLVRYPDTKLQDFDLRYAVIDVVSLHEAVEKLLSSENDTLVSIPLTSTGYVRREARDRCNDKVNHTFLLRTTLDSHQYKMCKAATRGGDTHANIYYIAEVLHNVHSFDRSSSYPHLMVTGKDFPITKYTIERNLSKLKEPPKGLSCIMLVEFRNLQLKPHKFLPYLPFSKALKVIRPKYNDNGRVLSCECYVIVITEVDFKIITESYTYTDIVFHELMVADKGQLPKKFREYIMELYIRKCELKGGDQYFYDKYKNRLNSTFGMMLTDITREEIVYDNGKWQEAILPDIETALSKYYNNPKSFLVYQAGVYVTAMARRELRRSIDVTGVDTVYVDTDSNKHIRDHNKDFDQLNALIHTENMMNDIIPIVTVNGKTYEMGIWEDEGKGKPKYADFVTMGAKKYAYRYFDDTYGVTVAGLNKEKGAKLLSNVGLEKFTDVLIFDPTFSGRLTAKYDDEVRYIKTTLNGHPVEITSNVALLDTSYTLSLSPEFARAVRELKQGEVSNIGLS